MGIGREGERAVGDLVRNKQLVAPEGVVEPGGGTRLEFIRETGVDLPVEDAVAGEDEPARVAE